VAWCVCGDRVRIAATSPSAAWWQAVEWARLHRKAPKLFPAQLATLAHQGKL
jgi:hypothetical protein